MTIKVAMTVDGNVIESGTLLDVVDKHGVKIRGYFARAYSDGKVPNKMNVVIKKLSRDKIVIDGTNAESIEVVG